MCESVDCDCPCHRGETMPEDFISEATFQRIKRDVAAEDSISIMENCTIDVPLLVHALDFYKNDRRLDNMASLVSHTERFLAQDGTNEEEAKRALAWMRKTLEKIRKIEEQTNLAEQ